jgi:hypothetical protein
MKVLVLAFLSMGLAGCGGFRMASQSRDPMTKVSRDYTREDPDVRSFTGGPGGRECGEVREGRRVLSLCSEPEGLRAESMAVLRFQAAEEEASGPRPLTGGRLTLRLHHRGDAEARKLLHEDPTVSVSREISPGTYEVAAVFPTAGKWGVEVEISLPPSDWMRGRFFLRVEPAVSPER